MKILVPDLILIAESFERLGLLLQDRIVNQSNLATTTEKQWTGTHKVPIRRDSRRR